MLTGGEARPPRLIEAMLGDETVRLGLPLTVNVVVHRANIERIAQHGIGAEGIRMTCHRLACNFGEAHTPNS